MYCLGQLLNKDARHHPGTLPSHHHQTPACLPVLSSCLPPCLPACSVFLPVCLASCPALPCLLCLPWSRPRGTSALTRLVQQYLESVGTNFCRLDGSTTQAARATVVNQFNKQYVKCQYFLLSTKGAHRPLDHCQLLRAAASGVICAWMVSWACMCISAEWCLSVCAAGGAGLNLTAASRMIMMDADWYAPPHTHHSHHTAIPQ